MYRYVLMCIYMYCGLITWSLTKHPWWIHWAYPTTMMRIWCDFLSDKTWLPSLREVLSLCVLQIDEGWMNCWTNQSAAKGPKQWPLRKKCFTTARLSPSSWHLLCVAVTKRSKAAAASGGHQGGWASRGWPHLLTPKAFMRCRSL